MTAIMPLFKRAAARAAGITPGTVLTALLALIIAGCASQPGERATATADPAALEHWQVVGKLGYRSPDKNGRAWIDWRQQKDTYQVRLTGPFGAGATEIRGDGDSAVLSQSGEQDVTAASGEALSAELFGWPFPVTELRYWIRGLSAPSSRADSTANPDGTLSTLSQRGWQLQFSDYGARERWRLPGRIRGHNGDYGFTLVIKTWQPLTGAR